MRTLYHNWFCPFSRKIRVALHEKGLDFSMRVENVWERRPEFMAINPACTVPVLQEPEGLHICDNYSLTEYLEESYPEVSLIGETIEERAEIRRVVDWFDNKFYREVGQYLIREKVTKRLLRQGSPNSDAIRAAANNIRIHLDYIGYLADRRDWLGGNCFSYADIAAVAHLSVMDYLGAVPWQNNPLAKEWYMRMKSRPSIRPLLKDVIPGIRPPAHYADLDF